jgi:hypothetical protein
VAWSWIEVGLFYDLSAQSASLFNDCIKVVHLEPKQDAVSVRRGVRVDKTGVIVLVPGMELKHQATSTEHPFIQAAMAVLREGIEPQQLSIPAAAGSYITHRNEGLRMDSRSSRLRSHNSLLKFLPAVYSCAILTPCNHRRDCLLRKFAIRPPGKIKSLLGGAGATLFVGNESPDSSSERVARRRSDEEM